jgi:hypothetical protein
LQTALGSRQGNLGVDANLSYLVNRSSDILQDLSRSLFKNRKTDSSVSAGTSTIRATNVRWDFTAKDLERWEQELNAVNNALALFLSAPDL